MDCQGFVHTCRKCEKWHYDSDRSETCECGEDRHCRRDAVVGYKWCDQHGGPAPARGFYGMGRGIVSGDKSSFPLTRLAAKYNEARSNGVILSNRAVLEVLQERLVQLLDRIDTADAPERWAKLNDLWHEFMIADQTEDHVQQVVLKKEIALAFEAVYHDYMAWEQALKVIDMHRKTVETEVKIFEKIHGILTAEDAYQLVARLAAIVIRIYPEDPKRLKQVQYEFAEVIGEKPDMVNGRFKDEDE